MKTSNKILFGGLTLILLGCLFLARIAQSNSTLLSTEECSKLPLIKKELDFTFESISVIQNIEVILRQGDFKVELECAEMLEQYVDHYVEDGILSLNSKYSDSYACPIKFFIQCPTLKNLSVKFGSSVISDGIFHSPKLSLRAQNSAQIEMNVMSDDLEIRAMNSANVVLNGKVKYLEAEGVNSASIIGKDATINRADIRLTNSAGATLRADTISQAKLINSSILRYIGTTQLEDVHTVNSSTIKRVEH